MKKWFASELRVRYPETDSMKIVYHGNYLPWLEIGRINLVRELGYTYKEMEDKGIYVPVLSLSIQYCSPAYYDDYITVFTRIKECSKVRISFGYQVIRNNNHNIKNPDETIEKSDILALATSDHSWVNQNWKPTRLDREIAELYALLTQHASG